MEQGGRRGSDAGAVAVGEGDERGEEAGHGSGRDTRPECLAPRHLAVGVSDLDASQLAARGLLGFGEEPDVHTLVGAGAVNVGVRVGDDVPTLALEEVDDRARTVAVEQPFTVAERAVRRFGGDRERRGGGKRHE